MKKIFTLLILAMLCSFSAHTQQTFMQKIGLPESFSQFENYHVAGRMEYSIKENVVHYWDTVPNPSWLNPNRTKRVRAERSTFSMDSVFKPLTHYALNYLHSYIYEYGYKDVVDNGDGTFTLYRTVQDGLIGFNDPTEYVSMVNIQPSSDGYNVGTVVGYPYKNIDAPDRFKIPKGQPWITIDRDVLILTGSSPVKAKDTKSYTKAQLESISGLTEAQVAYMERNVVKLKRVDPKTNVTSIFGSITKTGDIYLNTTLVDGKDWQGMAWKGKRLHQGNLMQTMTFSWVVYNDCTTTTPKRYGVGGSSLGNLGECYRVLNTMLTDTGSINPKAVTIIVQPGSTLNTENIPTGDKVTYNQANQFAVLQIIPTYTSIAPEKNTCTEGYVNLKNGQRFQSMTSIN